MTTNTSVAAPVNPRGGASPAHGRAQGGSGARARWAAHLFSRLYRPNACPARCEHPQPDFLHPQPPSTLQGSLEPLERSRSPPESAMTTCPWPALLHPSSSHTSQGSSCRSCRTCPQAKPGTEAFVSTTLPASEPLRTPGEHAVGPLWRMFPCCEVSQTTPARTPSRTPSSTGCHSSTPRPQELIQGVLEPERGPLHVESLKK